MTGNPISDCSQAIGAEESEWLNDKTGAMSPGFTVTELLVVIAIIAILIGLLVPAVQTR